MRFRREYLFRCSVPTLWKCINDYELLKTWLPNIEEFEAESPSRKGLGTRAKVRLRQGTMVLTFQTEVIEWEFQQRLGVRMTEGNLVPGQYVDVFYTLAESYEDLGTKLTYEMDFPLKGLALKLLCPLIWVGVNKSASEGMARLKALAESIDQID